MVSFAGKIRNEVVVLPAGITLRKSAEVRIETVDKSSAKDPLVATFEKLAEPRKHFPKDYALNHGHYLRGEPKG